MLIKPRVGQWVKIVKKGFLKDCPYDFAKVVCRVYLGDPILGKKLNGTRLYRVEPEAAWRYKKEWRSLDLGGVWDMMLVGSYVNILNFRSSK